MEYIRETSDQSFRNLDDMARYLKAVHANNGNFQDAVKAAVMLEDVARTAHIARQAGAMPAKGIEDFVRSKAKVGA